MAYFPITVAAFMLRELLLALPQISCYYFGAYWPVRQVSIEFVAA